MKILILGNYWPHIRGGHRIEPLVRQLLKLGEEIVIVTLWKKDKSKLQPHKNLKIIYVKERNIDHFFNHIKNLLLSFFQTRVKKKVKNLNSKKEDIGAKRFLIKIYKYLYSIICIPDEYLLNFFQLKKIANDEIELNRPDIILSEFPVTFHCLASMLAKKHNLNWVADFVDPWSDNFNYSYPRFRQSIDAFIQKNILKNANTLVSVSPVWASWAKVFNHNSICIEHSFPENRYSAKNESSELIKFLYAGRIYPEKQNYHLIFEYLQRFSVDFPDLIDMLSFLFIGEGANKEMEDLIKKFNLQKNVSIEDRIPKDELGRIKNSSHFFLILTTDSDSDGWYTSKLFDYIGSRKNIVAIGKNNHNLVAKFILQNKLGNFIENYEDFQKFLLGAINEYTATGRIIFHGSDEFINQFSEANMAKRFLKLFNSLKDQ